MRSRATAPSWPLLQRTPDGSEYRIRPMCQDDAQRERDFILGLSPESRFQRFMHTIREPADELIARLLDVDGHARMALVAFTGEPPGERIIGVARYAADADGPDCEFGVAVGDAWQCRGIGTTLVRLLFEHAGREGFRAIYGNVLGSNQRMMELAEWLGMRVEAPVPGKPTVRAVRYLN